MVNFGGRKVEVKDVDFITVKEAWNEYHLEDGYRIRASTMVSLIS